MRYTLARKGKYPKTAEISKLMHREKAQKLNNIASWKKFASKVAASKKQLMALLNKLKKEKKRVVGYGATSKSTTVINYCGITPDLVKCIYDTTPLKIGKFSPGEHIPISDYGLFAQDSSRHVLLFAWNHKKEIMEKEQQFLKSGGKFITYVPQVTVCTSTV